MTRARLEADLRDAAVRLGEASGTSAHPNLSTERVATLEDALADAAGVPTVVDAVEAATRRRANRATGWPVTAWLSRLRPDPLKRLHLDLGKDGKAFTGRGRTSVPAATQVQRARVDGEVRAVADEVSAPLTRPWADSVRRASVSRLPDLNDRLDAALSSTELNADAIPVWAGLVRFVQWLLAARRAGRCRLARRPCRRPLPRRPRAVDPAAGRFPGADRDADRRGRARPAPRPPVPGARVRDRTVAGPFRRPAAPRGHLRRRGGARRVARAGRAGGVRPGPRRPGSGAQVTRLPSTDA